MCVCVSAMSIFSARYMHHYYLTMTCKAWPLSSLTTATWIPLCSMACPKPEALNPS